MRIKTFSIFIFLTLIFNKTFGYQFSPTKNYSGNISYNFISHSIIYKLDYFHYWKNFNNKLKYNLGIQIQDSKDIKEFGTYLFIYPLQIIDKNREIPLKCGLTSSYYNNENNNLKTICLTPNIGFSYFINPFNSRFFHQFLINFELLYGYRFLKNLKTNNNIITFSIGIGFNNSLLKFKSSKKDENIWKN